MNDKIKIDIISDVACPWCAVGFKRLEKAIEELGVADKFSLEWKPFELHPDMSKEGKIKRKHLAMKYNITPAQVADMEKSLADALQGLDFTFKFSDELRVYNTFDTHLLLAFAKEYNKQKELKLKFLEEYFTHGKDISNRDILLQIVEDVGLDKSKALNVLDDDIAKMAVRKEEQYWIDRGINSVPTMIFNGDTKLNGAYPIETYKQVLNELL